MAKKSFNDTIKSVLLKEDPTALSATLRPGSAYADPLIPAPGPEEEVEQPTSPGEGENAGAALSVSAPDNTIPKAVPAEGIKQQAEVNEEEKEPEGDKDDLSEDFEITEELSNFVNDLIAQGLSEEEIQKAIEENFELVEAEAAPVVPTPKIDMSEHVDALFAGESLSEEFKKKATTIFEAAVNQKLAEEVATLEKAYVQTLSEEIANIKTALEEKVDDYVKVMAEEWVKENEISIEAGLRTELTEDFISGLRNLFVEHYIDIPAEKVNVVEELADKVASLETSLNEQIEKNVELKNILNESKKKEILNTITEGLTDVQANKLLSLAESIAFIDESNFNEKVKTLRESYITGAGTSTKKLATIDDEPGNTDALIVEGTDSRMDRYVKALGRTVPRK